jgi:molybdenum cofactor cytidylyltransferase
MAEVALVVLAAGAASRMGSPKQLLPLGDEPMVRTVAVRALASRCRPVIVVTGAQSRAVRAVLEDLPLRLVENRRWRHGIGSSIRAGIREAVRLGAKAAIVTLGDQPGVVASNWDRLAMEWRASGCPVVASSYSGTLGAPALFARGMFPALLDMPEDAGCKSVIEAQPGELVARCWCPEAAIDLDTPDDYLRWQAAAV